MLMLVMERESRETAILLCVNTVGRMLAWDLTIVEPGFARIGTC
jgi:hypothetical protein